VTADRRDALRSAQNERIRAALQALRGANRGVEMSGPELYVNVRFCYN
jgi:hypothetical protein